MKYIRLLAMALLPLAFAACSDDEDFNGGAATVGFAESEISIKENVTALNVPIIVQGDHTGLVRVNVEVKDATGENVVIDTNVILTSGVINLPAEVSTVYAELNTSVYTSTDDLNRSFTLAITSAEGAEIANGTCKVNIEEAVDAYDKLPGNWTMSTNNGTIPVTIATNAAGDGYDCTFSYQGVTVPFHMLYSATGVEVVANETIATLNFGDPIGVCDVAFMGFDGQYVYSQNIPGMWNDTFDTITFELGMAGGLFNEGNFNGYTWFTWLDCVMTKQ